MYRYRLGKDLIFALEQRQRGQSGEDVTQSVTPKEPGRSMRVTFACGDSRPLCDLRTGQKIGAAGQATVDVPFERPALLGFLKD